MNKGNDIGTPKIDADTPKNKGKWLWSYTDFGVPASIFGVPISFPYEQSGASSVKSGARISISIITLLFPSFDISAAEISGFGFIAAPKNNLLPFS